MTSNFAPPLRTAWRNLFTGQRLQFFRLAADKQNGFRRSECRRCVASGPPRLSKNGFRLKCIGGGVVLGSNQLGGKLVQRMKLLHWLTVDCQQLASEFGHVHRRQHPAFAQRVRIASSQVAGISLPPFL